MEFLKVLLCFSLIFLVDARPSAIKPDVIRKTFHSSYFDRLLEQEQDILKGVEGSAVVLKSNMPTGIQSQLATALTSIYQSNTDPLQRAQQFQQKLSQTYSVYWEVVINFDAITFYSQYYILLQINNDRVLGFGLQ